MPPKQIVIEIDDDLWSKAKAEAAIRRIPVKQFVAETLGKELNWEPKAEK